MKIILYAIAVGVVLLIIPTLLKAASDLTQDAACRTSVLARGNLVIDLKAKGPLGLTIGRVNYERITPILCNERSIGLIEVSKNDGMSDREAVKSQIAYLMGSCWEQFAEGKVKRLFLDDDKEYYCHICSSFRIPDDMDQGAPNYLNQTSLQDFINNNREPNEIRAEEMYAFLRETTSSFPRLTSFRDAYFGLGIQMEDLKLSHSDLDSNYINLRMIGNNAQNVQRITDDNFLILSDFQVISDQTKFKIQSLAQRLLMENRGSFTVVIGDNTIRTRADARNLIERVGLNSEGRYNAILMLIDIQSGTIRIHLGNEHSRYINDYELNTLLTTHFRDVSSLELNSRLGVDQNLYEFLEVLEQRLFPQVPADWEEIEGSYLAYLAGMSEENIPFITHIRSDTSYVVAYLSDERKNFWYRASKSNFLGNMPAIGALACIIPVKGWADCGVGAVAALGSSLISTISDDKAEELTNDLTNQLLVAPSNQMREYCEVIS